jgi:hypothetical protein
MKKAMSLQDPEKTQHFTASQENIKIASEEVCCVVEGKK